MHLLLYGLVINKHLAWRRWLSSYLSWILFPGVKKKKPRDKQGWVSAAEAAVVSHRGLQPTHSGNRLWFSEEVMDACSYLFWRVPGWAGSAVIPATATTPLTNDVCVLSQAVLKSQWISYLACFPPPFSFEKKKRKKELLRVNIFSM